jgi:hypothetical protein
LTVVVAYCGIAVLLSSISYYLVFCEGVLYVLVDERNGLVVRDRWTEESFSWDEVKKVTLVTKTVSPLGVPISPRKWHKAVVLDTADGIRVIDARGVNMDDVMLRLFEDIESKITNRTTPTAAEAAPS